VQEHRGPTQRRRRIGVLHLRRDAGIPTTVCSEQGIAPLVPSLGITGAGSHVPHRSLHWTHAASTPVTTRVVSRPRPHYSQAYNRSLVLMTSQPFDVSSAVHLRSAVELLPDESHLAFSGRAHHVGP
jgi:hypothetical protein